MQRLAGLITESQLNESSKEQVEKQVFDFVNSPEVGALIDKMVTKLDPKAKQQLSNKIQAVAEGTSDDFSQFKHFAEKGLKAASQNNINEDEMEDLEAWTKKHDFGQGFVKQLGKILSTLGVVNIMSMGMLPALTAMASDAFAGTDIINQAASFVGDGGVAAVLSVVAGLVGGGILWRIGKALQGEEVTDSTELFEKSVNEALRKFRKLNEENINEKILSPEEQKVLDDIVNTLNEGEGWLEKIKSYAKKGLLTVGIIASLLGGINLSNSQKDEVTKVVKTEMSSQNKGDLSYITDAWIAHSKYDTYKDKIDKLAQEDNEVRSLIDDLKTTNFKGAGNSADYIFLGKVHQNAIRKIEQMNPLNR
jgi:hypothetical protein